MPVNILFLLILNVPTIQDIRIFTHLGKYIFCSLQIKDIIEFDLLSMIHDSKFMRDL